MPLYKESAESQIESSRKCTNLQYSIFEDAELGISSPGVLSLLRCLDVAGGAQHPSMARFQGINPKMSSLHLLMTPEMLAPC